MSLQNPQVSTVVCPCSHSSHAKAYVVEGLTKNGKKQLMCVQNTNLGQRCSVVGYICTQSELKCVSCWTV